MVAQVSLTDRARLPLILWLEDLATVLDLPSERSAKEFLRTHGVPHIRLGRRTYVVTESLVRFLQEKEQRALSREEAREKADETVRKIAPTARQRQRGRKPPKVRRD